MHEDKLIKVVQSAENESKYRVWNAINPPANMFYYAVDSPEEAIDVIMDLIDEQVEDNNIFSNAFGLQVRDDIYDTWDEWEDVCGEFGDEFDDIMTIVDERYDQLDQEIDEFNDSLKGE
jgi:hypothetical protein